MMESQTATATRAALGRRQVVMAVMSAPRALKRWAMAACPRSMG
jgi:hypothetical protein